MDSTLFLESLFPSSRSQASFTLPVSMTALGGRFDFAGGMSVMIPTEQRVTVRIAKRDDDIIQVSWPDGPEAHYARFPLAYLDDLSQPQPSMPAQVAHTAGSDIVLPVMSVLSELHHSHQMPRQGLDLWINWTHQTRLYPALKRAIQLALVIALTRHLHVGLEGQQLPMAAWKSARRFGDETGPQDFLANFYQKSAQLLPILAQPEHTYPTLSITGGPYPVSCQMNDAPASPQATDKQLRLACAMGYTLIAREAGASSQDLQDAQQTQEFAHLPFDGKLALLPVAEFERRYRAILPPHMSGGDWLRQGLPLPTSRHNPHPFRTYPIQAATAQAVYAQERQSHCLGLIRQLTRQPSTATYAALKHSLSELALTLTPADPQLPEYIGELDALGAGLGMIGLVPVRAAWERSYTLWVRTLPTEAIQAELTRLADRWGGTWLYPAAHP